MITLMEDILSALYSVGLFKMHDQTQQPYDSLIFIYPDSYAYPKG